VIRDPHRPPGRMLQGEGDDLLLDLWGAFHWESSWGSDDDPGGLRILAPGRPVCTHRTGSGRCCGDGRPQKHCVIVPPTVAR